MHCHVPDSSLHLQVAVPQLKPSQFPPATHLVTANAASTQVRITNAAKNPFIALIMLSPMNLVPRDFDRAAPSETAVLAKMNNQINRAIDRAVDSDVGIVQADSPLLRCAMCERLNS